jgi:small conductance mechanosensitive channel
MFLSARPLPDIAMPARGNGPEIVLLVTGAILLMRFVTRLGARITDRIGACARETDALVRPEAASTGTRRRR